LKTGVIEGQDNPLPTDKSAKFYEVTKYIVLTNHLADSVTMIIVIIPIVLPLVRSLGIDQVHFGVVITLNMMIGLSIPLLGCCCLLNRGYPAPP
jgi:TRAP-type C4-dicarboxylate transport system permease large subunit